MLGYGLSIGISYKRSSSQGSYLLKIHFITEAIKEIKKNSPVMVYGSFPLLNRWCYLIPGDISISPGNSLPEGSPLPVELGGRGNESPSRLRASPPSFWLRRIGSEGPERFYLNGAFDHFGSWTIPEKKKRTVWNQLKPRVWNQRKPRIWNQRKPRVGIRRNSLGNYGNPYLKQQICIQEYTEATGSIYRPVPEH